jgi:hypothetical protein
VAQVECLPHKHEALSLKKQEKEINNFIGFLGWVAE